MAKARAARAFALALLLLAPVTAGCIGGREALIVAISAPKAASGMTLFLVAENGVLEKLRDDRRSAEYVIYFGDRLIYPPAGRGASFPVDGRTGSVFIPYNLFVVGNGEYDVLVRYAGTETRARASVEKWVEYVYLHPFDRGSVIEVQAALASATGGRPEDRILTSGELILDIHYHGPDGKQDRVIGQVVGKSRNDATSTSVQVPRSRLDAGDGYYSFSPTFHNLEARDNVQVLGDPTMRNFDPPWNWIYIRGPP